MQSQTIKSIKNNLSLKERQDQIADVSRQLIDVEQEYIQNWRQKNGRKDKEMTHLTGLALSGGGIRSASFGLGVLQALAHKDLLKKFDYLSTVSGGGYIGASLTWLLSDQARQTQPADLHNVDDTQPIKGSSFGLNADNFPYGTDGPDLHEKRQDNEVQQSLLRYLREHGHYLSPGNGLNIFALIGVVLRGSVLNLMFWLSLIISLLMLGFWLPQQIPIIQKIAEAPRIAALLAKTEGGLSWSEAFIGYEFLLRIVFGILLLSLLGIIAYSIATWAKRSSTIHMETLWYAVRRQSEKLSSILIPVTLVISVIGLLPVATSYLIALGPIMMMAGVIMHLHLFLGKLTTDKDKAIPWLAPVASAFFLYGLLSVAFLLAYEFYRLDSVAWVAFSVVLLGIITGYFANLNYLSIHRFYRDRLMEAYLPDVDKALCNDFDIATAADTAHLKDFNNKNQPLSPYHLINANVVLVDSDDSTNKTRGGDNFILSPYLCGSNATGWRQTSDYMQGHMTLATAVAISAAAINPNTSVGGQGVTRNRLLSIVMSILNLRLGYWAFNPMKTPKFSKVANHIIPSLVYIVKSVVNGKGFTENEAFIELSDGGHFENLALYELIRRKVKLIVLSDAAEDIQFSFADFQNAIQRIEADFNVRMDCHDPELGPDQLLPKKKEDEYPQNARFSERGYMVVKIHYLDDSEVGTLVYLKSTLISAANFKIKGYKAQNPDFPDQSTADQFFDEVQFEAYRELGYQITETMINELKLPDKLV